MSALDAPSRRVGRPRDERAEKAILDATVALVGEVGFGNLTVDAVAGRAGVGKATIYRRWSSKEELVIAAVTCLHHGVEAPDTGSVAEDLAGYWAAMADYVRTSEGGKVMPALVAEAACNTVLGDLLHRFVDERRSRVRAILVRAQERGEIRHDIDLEFAIDMFSAPVFYRRLLSGAPLRPADGTRLVEQLLGGIGENRPTRRRSRE